MERNNAAGFAAISRATRLALAAVACTSILGWFLPLRGTAETASLAGTVYTERLNIVDSTGAVRAMLSSDVDGAVGLVLTDADGEVRYLLQLGEDDSIKEHFIDSRGVDRVQVGVNRIGSGEVMILDAAQEVRIQISSLKSGASEIRLYRRDGVLSRAISTE